MQRDKSLVLKKLINTGMGNIKDVLTAGNEYGGVSPWMPQDNYKFKIDEEYILNNNLNKPSSFLIRLEEKIRINKLYIRFSRSSPKFRSLGGFIYRSLIYLTKLVDRLYWPHICNRKWVPLESLKEYSAKNRIVKIVVCNQLTVSTPKPKTLPAGGGGMLTQSKENYSSNSIYIAKIDNALIHSGSNIVFTRESAIYHDLINLENDLIPEEYSGLCEIDLSKKSLKWKMMGAGKILTIPIAASFTDHCSSNYAHWLTEVLPRIAVFCEQDQFQHIPLIVDYLPHPNLVESLAAVSKGRKIYFAAKNKHFLVRSLYLTSVSGYVPFGRRNQSNSSLNGGSFNPYAFTLLRTVLSDEAAKLPKVNYPKKLYVRRKRRCNKRIKNGAELESALHEKGFVTVVTEDLNFLQQVILFSNAERVVCSSGSALSNLIFTDSKCDIRVPIIKHCSANYSYWNNMACACGNSVSYIFGDEDLTSLDVHSNFSFDINLL